MRLLTVGPLGSELAAATRVALARGVRVRHVDTVAEALSCLRAGGADLAMADAALDMAGLMAALAAERITVPVVACGIAADTAAAVASIRADVRDYIPLPPDPSLIAAVLEAVAEETTSLVYRDPPIARIVKFADQIARSDAPILITGEGGTGKTVLARHIHRRSGRSDRPLVSVDCAAALAPVLESVLFGHEKDAFAGAVARRIGAIEEANGATLLLREVGELDIGLQDRLLQAIQERAVGRVGGERPVPVDIRILATSSRDLTAEAGKGTFREDLLYRLNVVNLHIPPLRKRPGDIAELAAHFIRRFAELNGVAEPALSDAALDALIRSPWPGNVRELEHAIHRAVLMSGGGELDAETLVQPTSGPASPGHDLSGAARNLVGRSVAEVERDLILHTLDHCLGNRTHAANILGISIRTLRNKLNQYSGAGIAVPPPGETRLAAAV